jgi:hypothetical protein
LNLILKKEDREVSHTIDGRINASNLKNRMGKKVKILQLIYYLFHLFQTVNILETINIHEIWRQWYRTQSMESLKIYRGNRKKVLSLIEDGEA